MQTTNSATSLSSLLSLAEFYKSRGDSAKYEKYMLAAKNQQEQFGLADMQPVTVERLLALYHSKDFEQLFALQGACEADPNLSELFFTLACSASFASKQPEKALLLAKHLKNPEQRRLRQKTAELWPQIFKPLPAKEQPRVHLLLLSFNRINYVEQALRELAATDYDNYAVYIADNGSEDGTLEVVKRAREIFPAHIPVSVEALPTNIGRPGGHNWLLTAHDHSQAEFIAIGDDDLTKVPTNWLQNMVQTARAFPGCACVGGKAVNGDNPSLVHGGVRNFTAFDWEGPRLTNGGDQEDIGQFDFIDIVDHVIGCLHIYRRSAFEETGLFDIRFSPCQYVDIDHHLRLCLAGQKIIFNGLISFEHMQAMGKAAQKDSALGGNSFGNMVKIAYKHDHEQVVNTINERHQARNSWLGL